MGHAMPAQCVAHSRGSDVNQSPVLQGFQIRTCSLPSVHGMRGVAVRADQLHCDIGPRLLELRQQVWPELRCVHGVHVQRVQARVVPQFCRRMLRYLGHMIGHKIG
jgi:hypothetical protein